MPDLRCAFTKRVFCECACERKFVHYPAVGFNRYINRHCRSIMIIYLLVHNIVRSVHRTSLNNPTKNNNSTECIAVRYNYS